MKRIASCLTAVVLLVLMAGCDAEQKVNYYNDIYAERPVTMYIAPVQDNAPRRIEKYPKDKKYNNELNTAKGYMYETLATPMANQGYYVIGPLASEQIAKTETRSFKEFKRGNIRSYSTKYGIDAILYTIIHKWDRQNEKWTVYIEYILRSTKSGNELMHTWVKATKQVPTNFKGDPIMMQRDIDFAKSLDVDNETAQRCYLIQRINDYVMRDIPISSTQRQYEEDMFLSVNPAYFSFVLTDGGNYAVEPMSMEAFEQGCFLED